MLGMIGQPHIDCSLHDIDLFKADSDVSVMLDGEGNETFYDGAVLLVVMETKTRVAATNLGSTSQ